MKKIFALIIKLFYSLGVNRKQGETMNQKDPDLDFDDDLFCLKCDVKKVEEIDIDVDVDEWGHKVLSKKCYLVCPECGSYFT